MSTDLHTARWHRIQQAMRNQGLDVLLLAGNAWRSDYLRYAVDVTLMEGEAVALITLDQAPQVWVQHPTEAARIHAERSQLQVHHAANFQAAALQALAQRGSTRQAAAPSSALPWGLAQGPWAQTIEATTAWLDELMVNKLPEEADAVERAALLADAGYAVFAQAARPGRREFELVADTEAWLRTQSCPENFMIVGSGGVEVRGMHPPGDRALVEGDLVTTELTPCVDGYYAQICRTLVVGQPSAAQRDAYAVFSQALDAGIAAVRPGATHGDIARAQNAVFRQHGLGEYVGPEYTRVRGHGMGLYVDGPHVLEDVNLVLVPGMTLIVHPNTYHPAVGYMVLGDTVRVTEEGCRVLTHTTRALISVTP